MAAKDRIYRDPQHQLVDFAFDSGVAQVFPDMIRRSVPAYESVVPLTGLLAARHLAGIRLEGGAGHGAITAEAEFAVARKGYGAGAQTGDDAPNGAKPRTGLVFDLGCSLGATTLAVLRQMGSAPCRIIAVDNSKPMLDRARELVHDDRVDFRLEDVRATDVSGADVILMNYVLQFLPPADREPLISRFHQQMVPGGLLSISEKIVYPDAQDQAFFDASHLAFKQANGYSDLEISGKRSALENVLIADTAEAHLIRLRTAGFSPVRMWFRCLNWASFLAWA